MSGSLNAKARLIPVDGDERLVDISYPVTDLSVVAKLIGCQWIEMIHCPLGMVMLVDEEGSLKRAIVNVRASAVAGQRIVGDVLMVPLREMK